MRKRPRYSAPVRAQDFHCLDSPHPYGLLPQGNRFLVDNNDDNADDDANDDAKPKENGTTAAGDNSSSWIQLNDECWSHILSFAEGPLLAKVAQLNRYFYVQAHQPELWRDLVLRRIQGGGTIDVVEPSWKDTYARLFYPLTYRKPHCPMAVKGVYSDFLYRLHSCRCFCIPQAWLDNQESTIDRVVQGEITAERFFAEYEQPNKPLVIEGGAKSWEAFRKWPDALYCLQQTKGRTFRATSGVAPLPAQFSLQAYYKYGQMPSLEEAPVYLFDRTALFPNSPLWQDFYPDLCQSLPFWDPQHPQHDLFQYLGEGARPDHTWWIVGPRRSGSVFHIDVSHCNDHDDNDNPFCLMWKITDGFDPSTLFLTLSHSYFLLLFWVCTKYSPTVRMPGMRPLSDGNDGSFIHLASHHPAYILVTMEIRWRYPCR